MCFKALPSTFVPGLPQPADSFSGDDAPATWVLADPESQGRWRKHSSINCSQSSHLRSWYALFLQVLDIETCLPD
jgi:hypothetical protein